MASQLSFGNTVAGAIADSAVGVLTDWYGRGDLTRERLLNIVTLAGVPREWLPAVKDAAVQLSRACVHVAGVAYESKVVRKPVMRADLSDDERTEFRRANSWTCRRALVPRRTGDVKAGDAYGRVALVVTMWEDESEAPRLTFDTPEGNEALESAVLSQYEARIASERYVAADVTKWLGELLRRRLGAVRYGRAWFVPRANRGTAESLCEALRESGWGHSWLYPALPITTSAQLSKGIAIGLQEEIAALCADLGAARTLAREAGRADIGPRAHGNYVVRFGEVSSRIGAYRDQLGPELYTECTNVLIDATMALDEIAATFDANDLAA